MWYISYWFYPVFSSLVWLAMLIAMLVWWSAQGKPHYTSMDPTQHIAYISDVGASSLKPLFIAMSAVAVVTFDLAFILERWLRHTGRLHRNTSVWQKVYSLCSCIAAIVGAAGMILLTIFDTLHHNRLHHIFLGLFIGGYVVSAIFICLEYQRLGFHYRHDSVLRYSFWIKLAFIVIEVALAIAFGVMGKKHKYNTAAVLEWTVSFIFFFYVLSFFIDFMPAVRSKNHQSKQTEMNMQTTAHGDGDAGHHSYFRGARAAEMGHANGYANEPMNGFANGHTTNGYANPKAKPARPPPSQNF